MQIDVLTLIAPPAAFRQANGLAAPDHTMWTYLDTEKLVYIKGPQGYPWDWCQFDDQYIYMLMTENKWSDPATAKINYKEGVPRFPRWIDYSPDQQGMASKQFSLGQPRTDYMIINPDGSATANSNGNVTCLFYGPIAGAMSGDLPAGNDWVGEYRRAGAVEKLTHREGFGRYKWEQFDAAGKRTASSVMDKIVAQPCPAPVQHIF